jgi:histidine phosphotransferase ChpT
MNSADFASLLCSRLCHDLVGPVGSLYNGVELLADEHDPDMRARCLELLSDSARQTANKLKFFRLAFGAAGGFGDQVDTREAQAALEGLFNGERRVNVQWMVHSASLPKNAVKLLLNLAMIAGDALLRGGDLQVAAEPSERGTEIAVRAEGQRMLLDPELRAALGGGTDPQHLTPRAAAAYLVYLLLQESSSELMISEPQDGVLVFGAVLPANRETAPA